MTVRALLQNLRMRCLLAAVAVTAVLGTPSVAQERVVPPSVAALRMSYAPIVRQVTPAVVTVSAAKAVANRNPLFEDPFFRRFFGRALIRFDQS
jgi:S1-C subfamily serine protease